MKLFQVSVLDDAEEYCLLVVAESEREAEDRVAKMDCWSCFMFATASEVREVDGYKVVLEKVLNGYRER